MESGGNRHLHFEDEQMEKKGLAFHYKVNPEERGGFGFLPHLTFALETSPLPPSGERWPLRGAGVGLNPPHTAGCRAGRSFHLAEKANGWKQVLTKRSCCGSKRRSSVSEAASARLRATHHGADLRTAGPSAPRRQRGPRFCNGTAAPQCEGPLLPCEPHFSGYRKRRPFYAASA